MAVKTSDAVGHKSSCLQLTTVLWVMKVCFCVRHAAQRYSFPNFLTIYSSANDNNGTLVAVLRPKTLYSKRKYT